MKGSFVFNRASGKDLTSDIVEKLEKSANSCKQRLLDHRDLNPFLNYYKRRREYVGILSVYPSPPLHPSSLYFIFLRATGRWSGGKERRQKRFIHALGASIPVFIFIVEQCHKSLKWLIVFLNKAWFGNTFQKFKVKQQTFILHFPGITSVSSITMRDY